MVPSIYIFCVCFDIYFFLFVLYMVPRNIIKRAQDGSGVFICQFILLVYLTKVTVKLNQKLAILKAGCSVLPLRL